MVSEKPFSALMKTIPAVSRGEHRTALRQKDHQPITVFWMFQMLNGFALCSHRRFVEPRLQLTGSRVSAGILHAAYLNHIVYRRRCRYLYLYWLPAAEQIANSKTHMWSCMKGHVTCHIVIWFTVYVPKVLSGVFNALNLHSRVYQYIISNCCPHWETTSGCLCTNWEHPKVYWLLVGHDSTQLTKPDCHYDILGQKRPHWSVEAPDSINICAALQSLWWWRWWWWFTMIWFGALQRHSPAKKHHAFLGGDLE